MDRKAFLQTICVHPGDDAPRLVYADWLDECGDPLGEFIRVQVELAKIKESHGHYARLRARQLELMLANVPTWVQPYGMQMWGVEFRRGFIRAATVDAHALVDDQLWFERWPWEELRLRNAGGCLEQLLRWPQLSRLKKLDFSQSYLRDGHLRRLTQSPYVRTVHLVRSIELGSVIPTRQIVADLLAAFGGRVHWSGRDR
jgi:uncharacterized protein (TIGR02996 family)